MLIRQYFSYSHLFFIAKRILLNGDRKRQVSSPIIHISVITTALSLTVMILSVAIVIGFKREVQSKVIGFGSHIQITNLDNNIFFYETYPITVNISFLEKLKQTPNVYHIQSFATKSAIIKTKNNFQGVILKGVDKDFDWNFFKQNLIEGSLLNYSKLSDTNVILSKNIANKLNLKMNDTFTCYFIQNSIQTRKYRIVGIYQSNFVDYDKLFILCNIIEIQRLNNWDRDMISGIEILVNDYKCLDKTIKKINCNLLSQTDRLGNHYCTYSIKKFNPTIFAWLDVLNTNMVIILILMSLIAGFSMISVLLIIILEHVNMIGILKIMGESSTNIRKIFLYISAFLIWKGLIWGNAIALFICLIQKYTGIFKLNPEIYYVSTVPIYLNTIHLFLINSGMVIITLLILIIPSYLVAKILPVKTIRFE